jgi:putative transcriptional regulator
MIESFHRTENCLLIAMPQLQDPNFSHTVSLLSSFDRNGAFALILNRTINLTAGQILQEKIQLKKGEHLPVYFGGPVQINSLWFLHAYPEFHSQGLKILDGVYLTTDLPAVEAIVNQYGDAENPRFRFFLGYAGWAPGQLENEISQGSWVTCPVDLDELFCCSATALWNAVLARMGIKDPFSLVSPLGSGSAH